MALRVEEQEYAAVVGTLEKAGIACREAKPDR
jgi:hypothetical protein